MTDRVPCPLIITHQCDDPPLEAHRWIAAFYVPTFTGSEKGGDRQQAGWKRLPVMFNAATEARAHTLAASWWEAEQDKAASVRAGHEKRIAAQRAKREVADA